MGCSSVSAAVPTAHHFTVIPPGFSYSPQGNATDHCRALSPAPLLLATQGFSPEALAVALFLPVIPFSLGHKDPILKGPLLVLLAL